jgi:hypothetical protein
LVVEDAVDDAAVGDLFGVRADWVGVYGQRGHALVQLAAQNLANVLADWVRRLILLVVLDE